MAYRHLGQAPAPAPDVSTTTPLAQQILTAKRGFVAVPYVQAQLITVGIGFVMGLTIGAVIGEKFRGRVGYQGKHVAIHANKRRSRRRVSRNVSGPATGAQMSYLTRLLREAQKAGYYGQGMRWAGRDSNAALRSIGNLRHSGKQLASDAISMMLAAKQRGWTDTAVTTNRRRTSRRRRSRPRRVSRNVAPSAFLRDEASPLDYHGYHPQRLAVIDPLAPSSPKQTYFTPSKIGSPGKRKTEVPGAPEGTVGFLDYTVRSDGSVYIHYMATRQDMRKQGVMRMMVDEIFRRYTQAPWVDFGDVYSDSVWKLFLEKKQAGYRVYGKLR